MVQAAAACINNEESRRPNIDEIISILRGAESNSPNRKKSGFPGNNCIVDCYSQLQQTKNKMKTHLALAMLGVSELKDNDHLYCRCNGNNSNNLIFSPYFNCVSVLLEGKPL
ncbi:unnamed protein product [Ilex paraguariensis]|uniref:Uncharacterized protein n=1 Tax=Ilex paraguariensis TaxID=185542 RepID=A0ABC8T2D8_9AQUA